MNNTEGRVRTQAALTIADCHLHHVATLLRRFDLVSNHTQTYGNATVARKPQYQRSRSDVNASIDRQ